MIPNERHEFIEKLTLILKGLVKIHTELVLIDDMDCECGDNFWLQCDDEWYRLLDELDSLVARI
jgi:hypothetical protein